MDGDADEGTLALPSALLDGLTPGGLFTVQVLYECSGSTPVKRAGRWLYANVPALRSLLDRRGGAKPCIQMNPYPLGQVCWLLESHGVTNLHVKGASAAPTGPT